MVVNWTIYLASPRLIVANTQMTALVVEDLVLRYGLGQFANVCVWDTSRSTNAGTVIVVNQYANIGKSIKTSFFDTENTALGGYFILMC